LSKLVGKNKKQVRVFTEDGLKGLTMFQLARVLSIGAWFWILGIVCLVFASGAKCESLFHKNSGDFYNNGVIIKVSYEEK